MDHVCSLARVPARRRLVVDVVVPHDPAVRVDRDEARGEYVINGDMWWITGAGSLHCKIMILMGQTNPDAPRHAHTKQN